MEEERKKRENVDAATPKLLALLIQEVRQLRAEITSVKEMIQGHASFVVWHLYYKCSQDLADSVMVDLARILRQSNLFERLKERQVKVEDIAWIDEDWKALRISI